MNRLILLILAILISVPQVSFALPSHKAMKTKLNQNVTASDGSRFRLGDQLTNKKVQVLKATYDVLKDGGTIGDHYLKDVDGTYAKIPENAIVTDVYLDVINALSVQRDGPIVGFGYAHHANAIKSGMTHDWYYPSSVGVSHILPVDGTTTFKTTADSIVYATVAGGTLNGGTMNLFIEYLLSD